MSHLRDVVTQGPPGYAAEGTLRALHDDFDAQRLMPLALDLDRLFADASEFSRRHSSCRSLPRWFPN